MGVMTASRAAMRADKADKTADQSRGNPLTQITTYIPSDVLAIYVAALAVVPAGDGQSLTAARSLVFALAVALCVALPLLNQWAAVRSTSGEAKHPRWRKQVWVGLLAVVAFAAYAMALPNSVFTFTNAGQIGAVSALVLSILLPPLASGLRIAPSGS